MCSLLHTFYPYHIEFSVYIWTTKKNYLFLLTYLKQQPYFNTKIIVNNIFSSYKPIIKYNSNKIDPLSFDFVRNNSFNASSCYEDKECRISIDKTAIDILHFYFSQVTDEYFKKINEKFTSNQEDAYSFHLKP